MRRSSSSTRGAIRRTGSISSRTGISPQRRERSMLDADARRAVSGHRGANAMTAHATAQDASADEGAWIVIPAYNEARTIRGLAETALSLCVRVLVVDDGSSDGTAAQLEGLPLTVLRHPVNRGKAAGLRAAFAHALARGATCVVTLDGDGQHDPRDATKLLGVWRQSPDRLVVGARLHDRAHIPRCRYFGNRIACFWISWAAGHPVA